jgi:hypothetical protein
LSVSLEVNFSLKISNSEQQTFNHHHHQIHRWNSRLLSQIILWKKGWRSRKDERRVGTETSAQIIFNANIPSYDTRRAHKLSSMLIFLPTTLRGLFSSKENTINFNQPSTHFQNLYVFSFMIIKLNVHGFSL